MTTNLPARRTTTAVATHATAPAVRTVPNRQARRDLTWIGYLALVLSAVLLFGTLLGLGTA